MKIFSFKHSAKSISSIRVTRSLVSRIGRDPRIDWVLIIIVFSFLVIILVTISALKYTSFDSNLQNKVSAVQSRAAEVIDTKSLDLVIKRFDDRETLRRSLLGSYAGPSDPSI